MQIYENREERLKSEWGLMPRNFPKRLTKRRSLVGAVNTHSHPSPPPEGMASSSFPRRNKGFSHWVPNKSSIRENNFLEIFQLVVSECSVISIRSSRNANFILRGVERGILEYGNINLKCKMRFNWEEREGSGITRLQLHVSTSKKGTRRWKSLESAGSTWRDIESRGWRFSD